MPCMFHLIEYRRDDVNRHIFIEMVPNKRSLHQASRTAIVTEPDACIVSSRCDHRLVWSVADPDVGGGGGGAAFDRLCVGFFSPILFQNV